MLGSGLIVRREVEDGGEKSWSAALANEYQEMEGSWYRLRAADGESSSSAKTGEGEGRAGIGRNDALDRWGKRTGRGDGRKREWKWEGHRSRERAA